MKNVSFGKLYLLNFHFSFGHLNSVLKCFFYTLSFCSSYFSAFFITLINNQISCNQAQVILNHLFQMCVGHQMASNNPYDANLC